MAQSDALIKVGLIGAAGYLAYRYLGPALGLTSSTPASTPPPATGGGTPPAPVPTGGGTTAPPAATTPLVNADTLNQVAIQHGTASGTLSPDQWNWLVMNGLHAPGFDLDAAFGNIGSAGRDSVYTAGDFLDVATGRAAPHTAPATTPASTPATGGGVAQIYAASGNAQQLNPDQWNYYVVQVGGQPFDLDARFGAPGTFGRNATYTAQGFLSIASGASPLPEPPPGMSGCGYPCAGPGWWRSPVYDDQFRFRRLWSAAGGWA